MNTVLGNRLASKTRKLVKVFKGFIRAQDELKKYILVLFAVFLSNLGFGTQDPERSGLGTLYLVAVERCVENFTFVGYASWTKS